MVEKTLGRCNVGWKPYNWWLLFLEICGDIIMGKKFFGSVSIVSWIVGMSVIIFNNTHQLIFQITKDLNLLYSFIIITTGVSAWAIINRKQFKK